MQGNQTEYFPVGTDVKTDLQPEVEIGIEPIEDEQAAPVSLKVILDGTSFIKEVNAEPDLDLHEAQTCRGTVYIRGLGHGDSAAILVGQWREKSDGGKESTLKEYDALATYDRLICMSIQRCVVNDKGEPLWGIPQVTYMYQGPEQAKFRQFMDDLQAAVFQHNPQLNPAGNWTALQRLIRS